MILKKYADENYIDTDFGNNVSEIDSDDSENKL